MKQLRAIFFDFDGVVVDSTGIKAEVFGKIYRQYGDAIERKVLMEQSNNPGVPRRHRFKYYHQKLLNIDVVESELDRLCDEFADIVVERIVRLPAMPGAIKFLAIHGAYTPCFLISATPQEELKRIIKLKRMEQYFQAVLGAPIPKKNSYE